MIIEELIQDTSEKIEKLDEKLQPSSNRIRSEIYMDIELDENDESNTQESKKKLLDKQDFKLRRSKSGEFYDHNTSALKKEFEKLKQRIIFFRDEVLFSMFVI